MNKGEQRNSFALISLFGGLQAVRRTASNSSFFFRLLIINLLIIIILVVSLQLLNFQYFGRAYNQEIEKLNIQAVRQMGSSIEEQYIKATLNTVSQNFIELRGSKDIMEPMDRDIRGDSIAKIDVVSKLSKILNTLPIADSVDILYPKQELLFYQGQICDLRAGSCDIGYQQSWVDSYLKSSFQVGWFQSEYPEQSGDRYITYARSIPYFVSPEQRKAVIAVSVNENKIKRTLQEMKLSEDGILLIINRSGQIISTNQRETFILTKEDHTLLSRIITSTEDQLLSHTVNGKPYIISSVNSQLSPWIYVSLVEKEWFYRNANQLKELLTYILIAVIMLGGLAAFVLLRRAQKPYRSILNDYSARIELLNDKVNANMPIIRHNYILHLLQGADDRTPHTFSELDLSSLRNKYNVSCSFLLDIHPYKGANHVVTDSEELGEYYLIIDHLEALKGDKLQVFAVMESHRKIQGFFCYTSEPSTADVIGEIVQHLDELSAESYVLCYGSEFPISTPNISLSYRQAELVYDYSFIYTDKKTISYDELNLDDLKETGTTVKILNELDACIRLGESARLLEILQLIILQVRSGHYRIEYCRHLLSDTASTLYKGFQQQGLDSKELFGYDLREFAAKLKSIREYGEWINQVALTAMERLADRKLHKDGGLELRIKSYIHENARNQLTLESVAAYAAVSPNYLSKIFKAFTGVTFIDYVTEIKLELAVALLKEQKKTVNEIAAELGYLSVNHFIRIFKQKYGKTPKQFQKYN